MPPFAVSVTKRVLWRGIQEQFSNIYHYNVDAVLLTEAGWPDLINAVVAAEKPAFGTNVTYVSGRAWGPTDQDPEDSVTRAVIDLSGTGTQAGTGQIPLEQTLVVQKYIGRSRIHNRKRFLRKYLHIARASSTAAESARMGNDILGSNELNIGTEYGNRIQSVTVGPNTNPLCAPDGTLHTNAGASWVVLPHFHIRQFRQ